MKNQKTAALLVGGDLACRVAHLLTQQGMSVTALRRNPATQTLPDASMQWIKADLLRPESLAALKSLTQPITHLLYAVTPDQRTEAAYRQAYVEGLQNLLQTLDHRQIERAVFVSSTAVYGSSNDWVSEETPAAPEAFNGAVLLEAEQAFRHLLGDKAVVVRLSGIYGPERTQLLKRLAQSGLPDLDHADQWTNRIHIDDAAGTCAHLLMQEHIDTLYIGTDDTPLPMSLLYGRLAQLLGRDVPEPACLQPNRLGGKRLSNKRLKASGYQMKWPDSLQGYRAIIENRRVRSSGV